MWSKTYSGSIFSAHSRTLFFKIGPFQQLVVLVIALNISLCNGYLLCFRHIVAEYNYVSWDILIKMLIS